MTMGTSSTGKSSARHNLNPLVSTAPRSASDALITSFKMGGLEKSGIIRIWHVAFASSTIEDGAVEVFLCREIVDTVGDRAEADEAVLVRFSGDTFFSCLVAIEAAIGRDPLAPGSP